MNHSRDVSKHTQLRLAAWAFASSRKKKSTRKLETHPKNVLHFEASLLKPLNGHEFRQWNITDGPFALCLRVAQRVCRQPKVALLEVPPTEALSILSVLSHHPVWVNERKKEIRHETRVNTARIAGKFTTTTNNKTHHSLHGSRGEKEQQQMWKDREGQKVFRI